MEEKEERLAVILLAAGESRRFNGNKMLAPVDGVPMYRIIVDKIMDIPAVSRVIVTRYREIIDYVEENAGGRITAVRNDRSELGISHSIQLGVRSCRDSGASAYMFAVCDQPWLSKESILKLADVFFESGKGIACLSYGGIPGNPVIFHERYLEELLALKGDIGGRAVMKNHPEDVEMMEAEDDRELADIDTRQEMRGKFSGLNNHHK